MSLKTEQVSLPFTDINREENVPTCKYMVYYSYIYMWIRVLHIMKHTYKQTSQFLSMDTRISCNFSVLSVSQCLSLVRSHKLSKPDTPLAKSIHVVLMPVLLRTRLRCGSSSLDSNSKGWLALLHSCTTESHAIGENLMLFLIRSHSIHWDYWPWSVSVSLQEQMVDQGSVALVEVQLFCSLCHVLLSKKSMSSMWVHEHNLPLLLGHVFSSGRSQGWANSGYQVPFPPTHKEAGHTRLRTSHTLRREKVWSRCNYRVVTEERNYRT